jgi:hypothetical protein
MDRLTTPFAAYAATHPHVQIDRGVSAALAERLMAEGLKSLEEIAASLPPIRGKRISTSSVLRWCLRGKNGCKLEAIRCHGGMWFSSVPALARWSAELTNRHRSM